MRARSPLQYALQDHAPHLSCEVSSGHWLGGTPQPRPCILVILTREPWHSHPRTDSLYFSCMDCFCLQWFLAETSKGEQHVSYFLCGARCWVQSMPLTSTAACEINRFSRLRTLPASPTTWAHACVRARTHTHTNTLSEMGVRNFGRSWESDVRTGKQTEFVPVPGRGTPWMWTLTSPLTALGSGRFLLSLHIRGDNAATLRGAGHIE